MAKSRKSSTFAGRAWRLLRLALLWGRKGGAFKRDLLFDLRVCSAALLKRLLKPGGCDRRMDRIHCGEREFSFEETPAFRFKTPSMRLPRIPCITPPEDFDFDDDDDDVSFFKLEEEHLDDRGGGGGGGGEEEEVVSEDGIDVRAEEFIARFYEEMKLQRQAYVMDSA